MAELAPKHLTDDLAPARIRATPASSGCAPAPAILPVPQLLWRGGARRPVTGRSKRRSMARCPWHPSKPTMMHTVSNESLKSLTTLKKLEELAMVGCSYIDDESLELQSRQSNS